MSIHVCTIVARNYLSYARVLAESLEEHHPNARLTALVLDPDGDQDEPFEVLTPSEVGIEEAEFRTMVTIYELRELATAVKPWLLRTIAERTGEVVVYLDPDIRIYRPLDDIGRLAAEHSIVLTPHTTAPFPDDGRLPDYGVIMQAGIYNLGFIAVSPSASAFLDWWSERLSRHCLIALDQALFVDQRWVDFVPTLFPHFVLRDQGCNVAYWNLHERDVRRLGDSYVVDGRPLSFFHFSGYKPEAPNILSQNLGNRARILLDDRPGVRHLCDEYRAALLRNGYARSSESTYEFDRLPNGIALDRTMRRLVRAHVIASERGEGALPPDPFDPARTTQFVKWMQAPFHDGSPVSRYAHAVYEERPDLQGAYPDVPGRDELRYLEALAESGQCQIDLISVRGFQSTARRSPVGLLTDRALRRVEGRLQALAHARPALAKGKPTWLALTRLLRGRTGQHDHL